MITAGVDIGSITTKAAVLADRKLLGTKVGFTGYNSGLAGRSILEELLKDLGLEPSRIDRTVSTGYGRNSVKFADKSLTEIICHAAGSRFFNPRAMSVIDIGGQDSKAILMDAEGRVRNFAMNDKCAAGTGRFLEVMARALDADLDRFGDLSAQSQKPSKISSLCTVFAESEVISLISKGEKREDIIAGIHESIASRVWAMAGRIGVARPIAMTGGVAKNAGVVKALEAKAGCPLEISPYPQENGAIGAAVLAADL